MKSAVLIYGYRLLRAGLAEGLKIWGRGCVGLWGISYAAVKKSQLICQNLPVPVPEE